MNSWRIAFFLTLLFSTSLLRAGEVVISGEAPSYKGKNAELILKKDLYTNLDTAWATSTIDHKGRFNLQVDIERIRVAWIRIDGINGKIYLEPGKEYRVEFPKREKGRTGSLSGREKIDLTFYDLEKHGLNNLVIDYNQIYEHFFVRNYQALALHQRKGGGYRRHRSDLKAEMDSGAAEAIKNAPTLGELLDSLQIKLDKRYKEVENEWFRNYVDYSLAPLREMAVKNQNRIYDRYFKGKKVLYGNEEYMNFFRKFYDKYLLHYNYEQDTLFELEKVVNELQSPTRILEELEKGERTGPEGLKELILIDGMFDIYYKKDYEQEAIHTILDSLSKMSPRKGTRDISRNLLQYFRKLRKGQKAPGFELVNVDTTVVSLDDLKGQYIYMNFWATWSETSIKELKIMKEFEEKYGHNIRFVSISVDDDLRDMVDFLKDHPGFDWTFLHLGGHDQVKEDYEVVSIPSFYLITPDGKLDRVNAPPPSGRAENLLHEISKRMDMERKRKKNKDLYKR